PFVFARAAAKRPTDADRCPDFPPVPTNRDQRSSSSPATFIIFHFEWQFGGSIPVLSLSALSRLNIQPHSRSPQMPSNVVCGCLVPLFVTLLLLIPASQAQQVANDRPREHFKNAEVTYDWVRDAQGNRLRTFITRPRKASGKL